MDLRERVESLPSEPGVYLFKSERGKVLYVGKAQNLRTRVRSYLLPRGDGRVQIPRLVERIADVEVLVEIGPGPPELLPRGLEHLLGVPDLVERRDHREHDADLAVSARPQDGPELRHEEVGTREAVSDPTPAEKRIGLALRGPVRPELVAPDVERPDHDGRRGHGRRDAPVRLVLLVLRWEIVAGDEQVLRSEQADSARPPVPCSLGLGRKLYVRGKVDRPPVERVRREIPQLIQAPLEVFILALLLLVES